MNRLTFLAGGYAATGAAAFFGLKPMLAASDSEVKTIRISELPIYDSDVTPQQFDVEAEKINAFRSHISDGRKVIWEYLDSIEDKVNTISEKYSTAKAHTEALIDYVHEDTSVVARVSIIGVAGLGGVVAGYRGGIMRKAFYSSLFATGAAAACYPGEASKIFNEGWSVVKQKANDTLHPSESKDLPAKVGECVEDLKEVLTEDSVGGQLRLTSTLSDIKEDFGMSKSEDKDLYANRSN